MLPFYVAPTPPHTLVEGGVIVRADHHWDAFNHGRLTMPPLQIGDDWFVVSVTFKLASLPSGNTIQQGNTGDTGVWKAVTNARGSRDTSGYPKCAFTGTVSHHTVWSPSTTDNDGNWHTLTCIKRPHYIAIELDGVELNRMNVDIGSMNSTQPIYIGAKGGPLDNIANSDFFHGWISKVQYKLRSPS